MKTVHFAIGVHNHQPVGNFPEVFEHATQTAYLPFLEVLSQFPEIRMSFHFTGILLEWLVENHPEVIDLLKTLTERGQIELLSGGYYEPILPMIPDRDKIGQIQKLNDFLGEVFNTTPKGLWLAERVWEPSLAKPIAEAGIQYTIVDDSHFKTVGYTDEQLYGYYVTEEQGTPLAIFPISERMRYLVPFETVENNLELLESVATEGGERLVVLADDGEKFGVWPGTHHSVYEEGWLVEFFTMLRENREWIRTVPFSEYLEKYPSLGPVYLPTASYTEMMQWALPAKRSRSLEMLSHLEESEPYRPFLRGGFWRVFLSKYRESNNLHKKMLYVGEKIEGLPESKRRQALDALWKGECNCAYWHGVFGGLYLNHLRTALYQSLIKAESQVDQILHKTKTWVEVERLDFFRDGGESVLVSTKEMNLYFNLREGGALFELDDKRKYFNLLNTMSRYEEAYHSKLLDAVSIASLDQEEEGSKSIHDLLIVKEPGLEKLLHTDWYRRSALIDHFLGAETTLEEFASSNYDELGDFVDQPYKAEWEKGKTRQTRQTHLKLSREGQVWHDQQRIPVRVEKTIEIQGGKTQFPIQYTLTLQGEEEVPVRFGVEFGFALQSGDTPDRYYIIPNQTERPRLGSVGITENVSEIGLVEEWVGIRIDLRWDRPVTWWRFPIETVSNSEGGFERVYQSSVVLAFQEILLQPKQPVSFTVELSVSDHNATP